MKKVLIIGNSHVGALKMGYERVLKNDPINVEFHFFSCINFSKNIVLKNSCLKPINDETSDFLMKIHMIDKLNLKTLNPDVILISGCMWSRSDVKYNYFSFTSFTHENMLNDKFTYSKDFIEEVVFSLKKSVNNSSNTKLLHEIANYVSCPVYISQPNPLTKSVNKRSVFTKKHINKYQKIVNLIKKTFYNKKIIYFPPPIETLHSSDFLTKKIFIKDSYRLDESKKHGDEDVHHANYEYGALFLKNFCNKVL